MKPPEIRNLKALAQGFNLTDNERIEALGQFHDLYEYISYLEKQVKNIAVLDGVSGTSNCCASKVETIYCCKKCSNFCDVRTNEEFLRDVCPNYTDKSQWNKRELLHILELHKEQLRLHNVEGRSEQLKCNHKGRRTATELVDYCEDCKKILFHP